MPVHALHPSDPAADGSRWAEMRTSLPAEWLHRYWITWAFTAEAAALASAVVIASILCSRSLRSQAFNKMIVGLAIPDFVFSFICGIACALNAHNHSYFGGDSACNLQSVYVIFGFAGSMWMNSLIAYELRRLATSLGQGEAYLPPSGGAVVVRILCIYLLSLFIALLVVIPGVPAEAGSHRGLACLPMEYDVKSTIFHWTVTMNLMLVVPLVIILWNFWQAYKSSPLSMKSNNVDRAVFVFFARLMALFVFMWVPSGFLIWMVPLSQHIAYYGGLLSHAQGFVSSFLYMMKPDINAKLRSHLASAGARLGWRRDAGRVAKTGGGMTTEISGSSSSSGSFLLSSMTPSLRENLMHNMQVDVMAYEQLPMQVIEFASWLAAGHIPTSSEGLTREASASDTVVFVSQRWWSSDHPDDARGSKYAVLCRGIRKLIGRHRLDEARVVLWIDVACISQENLDLMQKGIASLISYAARSNFMIVPVGSDGASVRAFRAAEHPMQLHNYGERAWCRLEVYIFTCIAEASQSPMFCYGFGATTEGLLCMPPAERLRSLFDSSRKGAGFDMSKLPSTGMLTVEEDRSVIHEIEENMRDIYVRMAILEQKLTFEAKRRTQCVLSEKQVRCKDVPFIATAFMQQGVAPRLLSLHLDGNLIADRGAAQLVRDVVLNPDAALTFLDLSGNSKLGVLGVKHLAFGLNHPACTLKELRMANCGLSGFELEPLTGVRFGSSCLKKLDLSFNLLDDSTCEGLLEACGGDQPFLDLLVQGNPLSPACASKVFRVLAAVELGSRRVGADGRGSSSTSDELIHPREFLLELEEGLVHPHSSGIDEELNLSVESLSLSLAPFSMTVSNAEISMRTTGSVATANSLLLSADRAGSADARGPLTMLHNTQSVQSDPSVISV